MDQLNLNADFLKFDKENNGDVKREIDFLQCGNFNSVQPSSSYLSNIFSNTLDVNANLNNRMPLDLSNLKDLDGLCKLEIIKNEIPYLVKYKLQDGKHVKIWQCKTCFKEFGHQYTLMRHLPTHTDERKFQCNTCGKAFRQMSTLSQHRAIHSHERPYVCEICQKTFNRVSTLISHRKTHTGIKPHQCHLCNKAFHQKGNLRNHIFTHTNERPYKCDDCGKGFNQMSNLMCHKLKSHQRMDKPKHSCQICRRSFAKRIALRNHEQYEHRESNQAIDSFLTDDQKISNAIFVEPIKTKAMQLAIETNQIPFALLRPLTGIPVLVRVLPAGNDKQMLVPASAEDLKKHGQISVTPKTTTPGTTLEDVTEDKHNLVGSTVQIKIPVVATVIQQSGEGGHMSMSVVSPGPNNEAVKQPNWQSLGSYILTATNDEQSDGQMMGMQDLNFSTDEKTNLTDYDIETSGMKHNGDAVHGSFNPAITRTCCFMKSFSAPDDVFIIT
nr:PREDICTED: zinc finger protein 774 isoform X1 [Tribolium castaneum]XP_015833171.1 PREDICTED: zinc finger protein 774 isoform X1 [Tribolium castaneum]XP_015833172.1 PREDICTED: zinc finger protein 774 isoform X1 [Tribolium castaneum]|eukprot:XP_008200277.1 PREDICTED: zinc finger protein 774 isoform X1 [Tribolium castaneum]